MPEIRILGASGGEEELAPAPLYSPPASKLLELCPKFAPWVAKEGRRRLPASSRSTQFTSRFKTACAIPETVTLGGLEGEDELGVRLVSLQDFIIFCLGPPLLGLDWLVLRDFIIFCFGL
ncbi:hypothetical protein P692DRAFT_20840213 [Suillus brevipes Sb2]|nr:hypothetical protein P692DRAFT_20840213 [Suillus brevipes Sb2]